MLPSDVQISALSANPAVQDEVALDARDVLLASATPAQRGSSIEVLASALDLAGDRTAWLLQRRAPDVDAPSTRAQSLRVGRVTLPVHRGGVGDSSKSRPFTLVRATRTLLEQLAVCVVMAEPVLLVGETGTGKTAAVSHIAGLAGRKLISLNLAQQTEASDLLGGFRPIDSALEAFGAPLKHGARLTGSRRGDRACPRLHRRLRGHVQHLAQP